MLPRPGLAVAATILTMILATSLPLYAQDYQIETVASGLDHPWSIAWLPDGRALVTERTGGLILYEADWSASGSIDDVPAVFAESQGGLFEVLPHPDYERTGWLYLSLAHGNAAENATRVVRAKLADNRLTGIEILFTAEPAKDTPVHYGGRMAFLPDGTLLVGLGDGFDYREEAQRLDSHLGTIVRIEADGGIPADNPFTARAKALPEIYSFGHRNVQGLLVDPRTNTVWQHEHGPRGGDEINNIQPGGNYGWPLATTGIDYSGALVTPFEHRPGMVDPELTWRPSIAPSGMTLYDGDAFPEWRGDLFVTALAAHELRRIELEGQDIVGQHILLTELDERLRDVRTGPDGALYVLTDAADGRILRLVPVPD